jgi:hypothetical protein
MLVGKFDSKNDMKHSCAQLGTKFVNSGDSVIVVAQASVENPYIRVRRLVQLNAILVGAMKRDRQHLPCCRT